MLALVGSNGSFAQGREQLEALAGLNITTKAVERQAEAIGGDIAAGEHAEKQRALQLELPTVTGPEIPVLYIEMDGTGVPMVTAETEGRVGKIAGERARTREAKLGCVFTQTRVDEKGRPVRDEASTTYTGAIETAEEFGVRLYHEVWQRGWSRAKRKVVLGDGAPWIWNLADEHFPGATQIVDLYHARQHLWELAAKLYPANPAQRKAWVWRLQRKLDAGRIESLVAELGRFPTADRHVQEQIRIEREYFSHNAHRMRYPIFRKQHLFIGSGVIEAGCKTIIGTTQAVRNVLDPARCQCHSRATREPPQWSLRTILGESCKGRLISTIMSRTHLSGCRSFSFTVKPAAGVMLTVPNYYFERETSRAQPK